MTDRDRIIQALVAGTGPLDHVHAMWEGGSAAFDRLDKWSDIDLYIVVDDDKVEQTSGEVEGILSTIAPIDIRYEAPHPQWPFLKHIFYHLQGTNEFLLIDIAIMKLNAPEHFLEPEVHGRTTFLFNKGDIVKVPPVDKDALRKKLKERVDRIKARLEISSGFIQKEIYRDNPIDALGLYHALLFNPLVEVLRIRHYPYHHDFGTRYLQYELPKDVVDDLERFYYVKDMKDLEKKIFEAERWLKEVLNDLSIGPPLD